MMREYAFGRMPCVEIVLDIARDRAAKRTTRAVDIVVKVKFLCQEQAEISLETKNRAPWLHLNKQRWFGCFSSSFASDLGTPP
jgi:hypothetical protein